MDSSSEVAATNGSSPADRSLRVCCRCDDGCVVSTKSLDLFQFSEFYSEEFLHCDTRSHADGIATDRDRA